MANGNTLTTPAATSAVSWLDVIDRNLQGWLGYFSGRKDPVVTGASPFGGTVSTQDVQLALAQQQLAQQQQMQTYLLLAAGAAVVLYLVTAK